MDEAVKFKSRLLQKKCQEVFSRETKQIIMGDSFLQLSQPALSLFLDVEAINVSEIALFWWVRWWMTKQCEEKNLSINGANMREIIGGTLYKIHFPTMTTYDFSNYVSSIKGLLTDSEMASVFQKITMFDNSEVECPFPADHRCRNNQFQSLLPEAKLLCKMTEIQKALGDQINPQGQMGTSALCLVLQCCADLANSTNFCIETTPQSQKDRIEVYKDFCALSVAMEKKDLSDIWTKFNELKRKLDVLRPWHGK